MTLSRNLAEYGSQWVKNSNYNYNISRVSLCPNFDLTHPLSIAFEIGRFVRTVSHFRPASIKRSFKVQSAINLPPILNWNCSIDFLKLNRPRILLCNQARFNELYVTQPITVCILTWKSNVGMLTGSLWRIWAAFLSPFSPNPKSSKPETLTRITQINATVLICIASIFSLIASVRYGNPLKSDG